MAGMMEKFWKQGQKTGERMRAGKKYTLPKMKRSK